MSKFEIDLQCFADSSALGSAVVGHRFWMGESIVPDVDSALLGVRSTPDLGSSQNTVEANTLDGIREKNVPGYFPATDIEFTFLYDKKVLDQQMDFINKEVWVYEERQNMTSIPQKIGEGILYKIKVGGVVVTGQSPEGLQEFTQSATLLSDEFYSAYPTYTGESTTNPTWEYRGFQTGKIVTASELQGTASTSLLSD